MSWPEVELGPLAKIRTGKLDANASSEDGQYPFFTCAIEPLRISSHSYEAECVLVAGNGDLNVKYYDGKFDAYQRTYIIESADKEKLNVRYLYHFMERYVSKLREMSIGGVIKYIKLGYLTEAKLPLPPLPEQKRIAAILDKADAIRRKRAETIRLTEELLKSAFLEMFGDPVTNPKGWEVRKLGELVEAERGISYGVVQRGAHVEDGIPIARISNIAKNAFDTSSFVRADSSITDKFKRTQLKGGELAVSIRGTCGRTAVVPKEAAGWNVSREVAVVPLLQSVDAEFVQRVILSPGGQRFILGNVKGVAQSGINLADLRNLPVPRPPKEEVSKFKTLLAAQARIRQSLLSSQDLRLPESLTQRAFRGEL